MSKSNIKGIMFVVAAILIFGCKFLSKAVTLPRFVTILCPLVGLILIVAGFFINEKNN